MRDGGEKTRRKETQERRREEVRGRIRKIETGERWRRGGREKEAGGVQGREKEWGRKEELEGAGGVGGRE